MIKYKFILQPTRNITSLSMKNLAFHTLLRWNMITLPILNTSLIHFSIKGWEDLLFELRGERVKWWYKFISSRYLIQTREATMKIATLSALYVIDTAVAVECDWMEHSLANSGWKQRLHGQNAGRSNWTRIRATKHPGYSTVECSKASLVEFATCKSTKRCPAVVAQPFSAQKTDDH